MLAVLLEPQVLLVGCAESCVHTLLSTSQTHWNLSVMFVACSQPACTALLSVGCQYADNIVHGGMHIVSELGVC